MCGIKGIKLTIEVEAHRAERDEQHVSVNRGEVRGVSHESVIGELPNSRLTAYINNESGCIFCHALDEQEAIAVANARLPALLEEARQVTMQQAVELQRKVEVGEVIQAGWEQIINDDLQPFPVGMRGSMWGRPSTNRTLPQ